MTAIKTRVVVHAPWSCSSYDHDLAIASQRVVMEAFPFARSVTTLRAEQGTEPGTFKCLVRWFVDKEAARVWTP